jgi:hypothetical protein
MLYINIFEELTLERHAIMVATPGTTDSMRLALPTPSVIEERDGKRKKQRRNLERDATDSTRLALRDRVRSKTYMLHETRNQTYVQVTTPK